jgi:hypothetical protein
MRRDQALWDERPPHASEPSGGPSSKEWRGKYEPWVPGVFETFRKVFDAGKFNREQEKRLKVQLGRARDEAVALDAIDLMFNEGVRYPNGRDVREAIDRIHLRLASQAPRPTETDAWTDPEWHGVPACCPGTFDEAGFVHWWKKHSTPELRVSAKRAAEGLAIMARWVAAAEAAS